MRTCLVCHSEKEVENLSCIYTTIGSEGTDLCIDCRITVSEFIRKMMALRSRMELTLRKKIKEVVPLDEDEIKNILNSPNIDVMLEHDEKLMDHIAHAIFMIQQKKR